MIDFEAATFRNAQATAMAGVDTPTLQRWIVAGQFLPAAREPGRGCDRLYTGYDIAQLAMLRRLTGFAPVSIASKLAEYFITQIRNGGGPESFKNLKRIGTDVVFAIKKASDDEEKERADTNGFWFQFFEIEEHGSAADVLRWANGYPVVILAVLDFLADIEKRLKEETGA